MCPKKKLTKADLLLMLLEAAFPDGVPTAEAARLLYGSASREARERVQDLARTLRKWGYHAYSIRGIYCLCNNNPPKFVLSTQCRKPLAVGDIASFGRMLLDALENGATGEHYDALKEIALGTAVVLRNLASKLEAAFA